MIRLLSIGINYNKAVKSMVSLNVGVVTLTATLISLLLLFATTMATPRSMPSLSSSPQATAPMMTIHRSDPSVAIAYTADTNNEDVTATLKHSGCRWTFWNKTGYFCGGGIHLLPSFPSSSLG
jgi:hypothetical protein